MVSESYIIEEKTEAKKLIRIHLLANLFRAHMKRETRGIQDLVKFQRVMKSAEQTPAVTISVQFQRFMKSLDLRKMKLTDFFGSML